jgi:putative two-component system hydrogenase maturation factor HypX/HoxX
MRILFLTSAHNSLSQRLSIELGERGHDICISVVATGEAMIAAAFREQPQLIIAPMLKIAIPEPVWSRYLCLIVHPGIKGDRGPSSLDWAIAEGERSWGVTILEAEEEFDSGPVWASHEFPLSGEPVTKSSLYRGPVTEAAVRGVLEAVARIESGEHPSGAWRPEKVRPESAAVRGRLRPPMRQADRRIDWAGDSAAAIIRKIRAADSAPGVLSTVLGKSCYLYGAHEEDYFKGPPGKIIAQRDGAICIGTTDGAVWISHLKAKEEEQAEVAPRSIDRRADAVPQHPICGIKLPAAMVLGRLLDGVPEVPLPAGERCDHRTFREIVYREEDGAGYLSFDFYNGAMSTDQCWRLRDAFLYARSRPTKVIVLLGGAGFWSNGIHLNVIEASPDPAVESWRNINAINDLIFEIINTMSHVVIAGLRGNAGAGGAMLALAADRVYARPSVVLNPHYRSMGGLYGSEYWTYTLPRRVGRKQALALTLSCEPLGARAAQEMGFLDETFGDDIAAFEAGLRLRAEQIARSQGFWALLRQKHERRLEDELAKPLAAYRAEELERMRVNFFGPDRAYHEARRRFVFKGNPPPQPEPAPLRQPVEITPWIPASEEFCTGAASAP